MKAKIVLLIFLVIFVAVAVPSVLSLSSSQIVKGNTNFVKPYSSIQVNGGIVVEPQGDPIDTPGGPGGRA